MTLVPDLEGSDALVPNTPHHTRINLQEVRNRNRTAREIVAALSDTTPRLVDVNAALDDIPFLVSAIRELLAELAKTRRNTQNLVAAGRATLHAHHDGEPDPLYYLRDELRAQGHLPPDPRGRA